MALSSRKVQDKSKIVLRSKRDRVVLYRRPAVLSIHKRISFTIRVNFCLETEIKDFSLNNELVKKRNKAFLVRLLRRRLGVLL